MNDCSDANVDSFHAQKQNRSIDVDDVSEQLKMLCVRAMLMSSADQPNEMIRITKEVLVLNEEYPGTLDAEDVESTKYWQAEAYSACGKWSIQRKSICPFIKITLHFQHIPK